MTQEDPAIELVRGGAGEETLVIDGAQAMQGWEHELMEESARLLCAYGSEFLEVGLGFGISALAIARAPTTRRHTVIEKHRRVIDLFREREPAAPACLEIVCADFFDLLENLGDQCFDGVLFDPWLPPDLVRDEALWARAVPALMRCLRVGGAVVPFFTTRPELRWPFHRYFDRVVVTRRHFRTYANTAYTHGREGDAYIQCFERTR